jgi:nitrate/TMAO reductase-like tetraheme cytochrome c subunit
MLIPLGIWLEVRRQRSGYQSPDWPVIDLRNPRLRTTLAAVLALTIVNLVIVSMAAFGGVHYMETSEFCGQTCHTTMEPQYVAHQSGPHARVACASCHIGAGAGALVESKLAGARQLLHVVTGRVPRPVPPPPDLLQPARNTCERCHWPEKFHGDRTRTIREYANDEANSETVTTLRLHVGGGSATRGVGVGIHWHMNLDNEIEYIAIDEKRETIPYVRLKDREGRLREFVAAGTAPEQIAAGVRRRMDCRDCHNRPAHTFQATPERGIDSAIAQGLIPRSLPFVRREAVAAVSVDYPDRAAALGGIARRLGDFYRTHSGADATSVQQAVTATQDVWSRNVFPAMKVTWGTYPNHLGHVDAIGCFRCHDDNHKAQDGTAIRQDCDLCHTIPE